MREGTAPIIRREDYQAPAYWIRTVDLSFDLDPAKTLVINKMTIERNAELPVQSLRLDGEDLNLTRVMVNGEPATFRVENDQLVLDALPDGPFTLEVRNTIAPEKNLQLSGLYTSGGGFFTQCEAQGFRRISYFLDRPDVMAVYTVTLRADAEKYPVLLGNGNLVAQGELDGGRHFAKWHDPFPKPSYLFALVAAKLVSREQKIVSRSGKEHLLQVYVRAGDLDKTEHAMNSLIASVVWDEARFGLPLDLERFMIVAVSDFNMGAMENKGLNIFNTKFVLASPATATDADFANIESVVAHEYFHNWTGNRVTCRDWFQLSLKEGLTVYRDQEFSQDMAGEASARAVKRIEDVRQLRQFQFPEDAGPMAHPVRPEQYQAIDNFYTATVYEKGAEVVRMMATLVGRRGFAKGMTLYFQRHDGQAVTCDDFAQAIADANPGSELAERLDAFKRWYSQAGTPQVTARGAYDAAARTYTLELAQTGTPNPGQPHRLPSVIPFAMGLLASDDGSALPLQLADEPGDTGTHRVLVLAEAEQRFVFVNVDREPVPSLLRGYSAPVHLDAALADTALLTLLQHDSDAFNRWEAGQQLALNRLLAALRGGSTQLDAAFIDAMRGVLRHPTLDAALKELVLTLPSETVVAEELGAEVDPARIHALREGFRLQLAQALRDDWVWAFETQAPIGGYSPDARAAGQRALVNLALSMLVLDATASGDTVWPGRAYQRFKDATSMSERFGALTALVNAHAELAAPALERFHALFADEALVIDKWFALQAGAPEPLGEGAGAVFERVRTLAQHPDFTLRNPNRARSLLMPLTLMNPAAFHRADAAGYVFWADKVVEVDAFNPQLASRLARSLDRWRLLAEPYRSAAREAIARVAARAELSDDTREIVTRSLQD
ncbi:aminopeptidase N [Rivibacter subsaxonicus]|uniref:Aminopeptidase N n=1 Tax=Rivibacter subsaxonicus TaxID=457575 RepID=A0A4Q7W015_9BURK|nr:aminopeptidase N [Rivibacter subsaxonicus]RZU02501.1 alanyl aminopeptidase [Rivibacter subsaxonicus]